MRHPVEEVGLGYICLICGFDRLNQLLLVSQFFLLVIIDDLGYIKNFCNIVISVAVLDDKGGTAPDPLWRWILPAYKKLSVQPVIYRCQIKEILHDLVM